MGYALLDELEQHEDEGQQAKRFDVLEVRMPTDAAGAGWVIANATTSHRINTAEVIGPWRYIVMNRRLNDVALSLPSTLRGIADKASKGCYAFVAFSQ